MSGIAARCALLDLRDGRLERRVLEGPRAGLGGWDVHLGALRPLWLADPGLLALSTGPLTGVGAPGSGGMAWCWLEEGALRVLPAEGRLGAALRCAGFDHLLLRGGCGSPAHLVLEDGRALLRASSAGGEDYDRLAAGLPDPDGALALCGEEGLLEDAYFPIGGRPLSRRLRERGLRSLAVCGAGGVPAADAAGLLERVAQSWRNHRPVEPAGRSRPARWLSPRGFADLEAGTAAPGLRQPPYPREDARPETAAFSLLGLAWDGDFPGGASLEEASGLLEAATGARLSARELREAARNRLEELSRPLVKGGAADE